MKISYVTMQFPAPSETFASNDIKSLKILNEDVDIYSLKNKHENSTKLIKERELQNLNIYHITKQNFFLGIWEIFKNIILFFDLLFWIFKSDYKKPKFIMKILAFVPSAFFILKQLEKRKPNILHLFWGHYPSVVAYLVHKRLKQTKISIFLGAYDLEYSLGVSKYICNIADYIFTHTKINIAALEKMGINKKRINVVYRGTVVVDENIIKLKTKHSFCSGGRLLKAKKFDKVIDVFYNYQKSFPDATLTIFGDGPEKLTLIEQVKMLGLKDKVQFVGFVRQEDVLKIVSFSEFFLFFSTKKGERLPNVLKEAMLNECVVISTYTPGLEELIQNTENGFILEKIDVDEIFKLISNLTEDKKNKIRINAKKYIIDHFNVANCMKQYLNIWQT